jgi:hypothetical protein
MRTVRVGGRAGAAGRQAKLKRIGSAACITRAFLVRLEPFDYMQLTPIVWLWCAGSTPLIAAAWTNQAAVVEFLLDHKATINMANTTVRARCAARNPPMHTACAAAGQTMGGHDPRDAVGVFPLAASPWAVRAGASPPRVLAVAVTQRALTSLGVHPLLTCTFFRCSTGGRRCTPPPPRDTWRS